MKKNKLILITVVIGSFVIASYVYLIILKIHDVNEMEKRRPVLLYETDHQALLEACRELSQKAAIGQYEHGKRYILYGHYTDPKTKEFPLLIRDIEPLYVLIDAEGVVYVIMSVRVMYGVFAFPENLDSKIIEEYKADNQERAIELIDGLWYFDNDFLDHPEHMKAVEESLENRGQLYF